MSLSSIITNLTGTGFYYERSPRTATYNFNQDATTLYRNHPRLPFEFYININLDQVATAKTYVDTFFNSTDLNMVPPLVKTIDMPSFKIESTSMNQYNRKRISQTKVIFEPIKVVFHDVADGKTLKFWEMYYRYYFADGTEPGKNIAKQTSQNKAGMSVEQLLHNLTPAINPNILSLPSAISNLFGGTSAKPKSSNDNGQKSELSNIIGNTLDNHKFGFNLDNVQNERNLIKSIDIFQVHGGRFNKVTLINPRIVTFTHDTLSYAAGDKTLELSFTFEYEYAYYTIQNLKLGGTESNNGSSLEPFKHGQTLELPALAFNATLMDFIQSNNPLLNSDNPILQQIGKNVQSSLSNVTGSFIANDVVRPLSASVLNGMAKLSPTPYVNNASPPIRAPSFASSAVNTPSTQYTDINRNVKNV